MIPITDIVARSGNIDADASGVIARLNRISPYVPTLSNTPASKIEPAVGASTWAKRKPRVERKQRNLDREPRQQQQEDQHLRAAPREPRFSIRLQSRAARPLVSSGIENVSTFPGEC